MNRNLPTFKEAEERVKISWFTKQGYDITGLVHVGANDGYEIEFYLKMGIYAILAFEPLKSVSAVAKEKYPAAAFITAALGNFNGRAIINVTPGDGKGSSLLPEIKGPQVTAEEIRVTRWATQVEAGIRPSMYNCAVIDVQGMELDVLRGMDDYIKDFDFLSVECSSRPIYRGEASADEVIAYLDKMGFQRDSDIPEHDDVMFINRRVLKAPEPEKPLPQGDKLNAGSGQCPFDNAQGWINMDISPKERPDLLGNWNDLSMFADESMQYVVSQHSLEHVGCNEGHPFLKEAFRVLKPGGSLLVLVPDLRALASRWMTGQMDTQIYLTSVYGPYDGTPGSRHQWGFDREHLDKFLKQAGWARVKNFDWRPIPGAKIARDFWILGMEAVK